MTWIAKGLVKLLVRLILVMLLAIIGVAVWQAYRDPLDGLPTARERPELKQIHNERRAGRLLQRVELDEPALGRIGLTISLPDPLPAGPLPVLIVLGGLGTGEENIRHIPDPGPNAVVGYDWPVQGRLPEGLELARTLPHLYARVLASPGQVAAAVEWLMAQPWADADRFTLLGFSLGTLAVPAVQRLAEANGQRIGWTVLAYGGARIGDLLAAHPRVPADWLRPVLGAAADLLFRALEPTQHLPHLGGGHYLVMGGQDDRLIPSAAAARLQAAVPEPKTLVLFDGDHMGIGPQQQALLGRIIETSRAWLVRERAVAVAPLP